MLLAGKVLVRIKCELSRKQQEDLANAVPGVIDLLLAQVRKQVNNPASVRGIVLVSHASALLCQTSKDDSHKASFKSPASSPRARVVDTTTSSTNVPATDLKSLKLHNTESRSPDPHPLERLPASPSSPRKAIDATSKSPLKSPRIKRPSAFALNEFLATPLPQPDQDDIAVSFSKMLELMSKTGTQTGKIAKPKATAASVDGVQHSKHPLTPENKSTKSSSPVSQVRPASADSGAHSHRLRPTDHGKLISPTFRSAQKAKQTGDTDGRNNPSPTQQAHAVTRSQHVQKIEFADSALVYFCCQDELPMRDEQQAWQQNDRVQVARFVRSLASGDCLVQLLKVDGIRKSSISPRSRGVKAYVSTPHFIECCGSQLHNIQNMKFDATEGKWKWYGSENSSSSSSTDKTPGVSWKRSLLIDIAPGVSSTPAGLRTEPIRKSLHPTVMTKKTSHNSHFFTEVLSRVKCNSISMEEPVAIVGRTRDEGCDGTLCADFAQTVYDTIGFDSPVAPTVFPKVQADVLLDIPEKKPLTSPTRARKSNAESVEAT